jgi:hypothetical protein
MFLGSSLSHLLSVLGAGARSEVPGGLAPHLHRRKHGEGLLGSALGKEGEK